MEIFSSFFRKQIHLPYSDFDTEPFFENKAKFILNNKISYKDEGNGPIIFCIPPWPMSSTTFTPFINAVKEYFRVVAIDLPGWGGESPRMNLDATIDNYVLIIEEFIKSFEVESFYLLGYSLGGMLAQRIIDRGNIVPEKVVFVSSAHNSKLLSEKILFVAKTYKVLKKLKFLGDFFIKKLIVFVVLNLVRDTWYFKRYVHTKLYQTFQAEEEKADITSIFEVLLSIVETDDLFKDASKKLPEALVIYSDQDEDFIIQASKELSKHYSVEPSVLKNCDHFHFFVDVNKSDQIVVDFLNESL